MNAIYKSGAFWAIGAAVAVTIPVEEYAREFVAK